MHGLMDVPPLDLPDTKRESLLNFIQGENDKETRLKVDSAFEKATLYNIEGVFVLDWENGLTEEYTCKNNIWVRIGINNNLYKIKIEQIKKDNQKDAPFYQGMTKEEVRESVCEFMTSEGDGDRARNKNAPTLKDPSKTEFYCFGHVVVVERGFRKTTELVRIKGCWVVVGFDNPYYKELIQESPTEKKELEEKEAFEDIERRCLDSIKCDAHLAFLKDVKNQNPNKYKHYIEREFENMVPRERKQVFEEHQHQKHLMEKEAQRKKEESEMKAKAQFKEPQLTAQDLIQAAKDELVYRIYGGCCSSVDAKRGFAECINFLEQTMGKDPYKN